MQETLVNDPLNLRLLDLLQEDARQATTTVAERLRRSESTVRERVRQLERRGVIRGYAARVDPDQVGLKARAVVRATVQDYARLPEVARALADRPHVLHAYRTSGRLPLTFVVVAESAKRLEDMLARDTTELQLVDVELDVVLSAAAEGKPLPLGRLLSQGKLPAEP